MDLRIVTGILLVIVVTIIICLRFQRTAANKEGFTERITATDTAEHRQRTAYGLQSCDALLSENEGIGNNEWNVMTSALKGMRVNKWKPTSCNDIHNPESRFCYIYNDPTNRIQDISMTQNGGDGTCASTNPMFAGNPMIKKVFADTTTDRTHTLPIEKCVFEIDPNEATPQNINSFWATWGSSHCDSISAGLRANLAQARSNLRKSEGELSALLIAESNMRAYYAEIGATLASCGACNMDWQNTVSDISTQLIYEEELFDKEREKNIALTWSNANLTESNATLKEILADWTAKYNVQLDAYNTCSTAHDACKIEDDRASREYRAEHALHLQLRSSNQKLREDLEDWTNLYKRVAESNSFCVADLDETTTNRNKMKVAYELEDSGLKRCIQDRAAASNELTNWTALYVSAQSDYNTCSLDKDVTMQQTEALRTSNADCLAALALLRQEERLLERDVQYQNALRNQVYGEVVVTSSNYNTCDLNLQKEITKVNRQLQFNVDVYNNLDLAYKNALERQLNRIQSATSKKPIDDAMASILGPMKEERRGLCKEKNIKLAELEILKQKLKALQDLKNSMSSIEKCEMCWPSAEQCAKYKTDLCPNFPA